jgi:hypothetical protein
VICRVFFTERMRLRISRRDAMGPPTPLETRTRVPLQQKGQGLDAAPYIGGMAAGQPWPSNKEPPGLAFEGRFHSSAEH